MQGLTPNTPTAAALFDTVRHHWFTHAEMVALVCPVKLASTSSIGMM